MDPHQILSPSELSELQPLVQAHRFFSPSSSTRQTAASLITQRIDAPLDAVWPIVRNFCNPQRYKHFIKSCSLTLCADRTELCQPKRLFNKRTLGDQRACYVNYVIKGH